MHIRVEHDTPVPPDKVQEYFFDLREDDHHRGNHPRIIGWKEGDYRTIKSRADRELHAQDGYHGGRVKVDFVLFRRDDNAIDYDVKGDWYDSTGRLEATPRDGGAHVTFRSDATWHGVGRIMQPFVKGKLTKAIHEDMREHLHLMDEDWAKAPW